MHALWHWVLWVLCLASHDAGQVELERARAAGCVTVAYAALAKETAPAPKPTEPAPVTKCAECGGTGKIFRSDGGYVRCKCGACPTGACPAKVLR